MRRHFSREQTYLTTGNRSLLPIEHWPSALRLALLGCALLLCTLPARAKHYEAEHYNVALRLDPQGILTVTESVDFHFIAGPFTYVFREIAATETDGIDQVRAWIDGEPCSVGAGPGQVEIRGSSPVVVRWHFSPVLDGTRNFTVQYRAAGVIRPETFQTLRWRALPPQRTYPIRSSEITLDYPPSLTPTLVALRSGPQFEIGSGHPAAVLVNPGKNDAVVVAEFPSGSFVGPPPAWLQTRFEAEQDRRRGGEAGGLAAVLLLLISVVWMVRVRLPSWTVGDTGSFTVMSPPDTLAPALAGSLVGSGNLRVGMLLDLARRGVVRIEEVRTGMLKTRRFQVVLAHAPTGLAPHEKTLLERLYRPGADTVRLHEFLTRPVGDLGREIRSELLAMGLLDQSRLQARKRLLVGGGLGFAAAIAILLAGIACSAKGIALAGSALVVFGAGTIVTGLALLTFAAVQSVSTEAGALETARWKAFARYLKQVARRQTAVPPPGDLDKLLPYAAVFYVMAPILKRQAREGGLALPPWFQAMQDTDSSDALIAFTSACDTSSASAGGDGGGGGGASGGGSSGAG